ncbi:MAG: FAD-dependent oxidoreductase [Anaerolineae bacterium]
MKIAIVGGGAAGLTTAYLLDKTHDITLFEKQPILGGNVRTIGKNVSSDRVPDGTIIDNGVIEFQLDHFVNFHKLLDRLGVEYKKIEGGSSSLFLANGRYILGPGMLKHRSQSFFDRMLGSLKLMRLLPYYWESYPTDPAELRNRPLSDFRRDDNHWHIWQKMLLMYGYSIPYSKIGDFPAEIAMPVLHQSGRGTRWTRIIGGVYSYMEAIMATLESEIRVSTTIKAVRRDAAGVELTLATGEQARFDKLIFATPPDQVLKMLADPNEQERNRFSAWRSNEAITHIHTDLSMYQRYSVTAHSEFDVFQKERNGDAGYNAYLNRLCGLPEVAPHYSLAYNLEEWLDPAKIVHTQHHQTPLYTAEALSHREAVRATNGENHTYHAGAWLGNGLHEGAIDSALAVSRLLGGVGL